MAVSGPMETLAVFQNYQEEIAAEVLAGEVIFGEKLKETDLEKEVEIDDIKMKLSLVRHSK